MNRKLIVGGIISFFIIIAIVAVIIVMPSFKKNDTPITQEITSQQQVTKSTIEERANLNKWDTTIVADITEDNIPIPKGFTFVQGNKSTGLIIEGEDKTKYLFIPYKDDINVDVSDYYKNVKCFEIENNMTQSIQKYNGFYVELNKNLKLDSLKTISQKDYEDNAKKVYLQSDTSESVNFHILYKEEIEQIQNYLNANNINLEDYTVGAKALIIEAYSKVNNSPNSTNTMECAEYIKSEASIYGGTKENPVSIPIPIGFRKNEESNGLITITPHLSDEDQLRYIWVPLKESDLQTETVENNIQTTKIKKDVWDKYKSLNDSLTEDERLKMDSSSDLYKGFFNVEEKLDEDFVKSIKKYGGFYISEAELSISEGVLSNTSRGMVDWTVSDKAAKNKGNGDYYRGSSYDVDSVEGEIEKIFSVFETFTDEYTERPSYFVQNHIMYGVEYDAAIKWILENLDKDEFKKTYQIELDNAILNDSTKIGKYSNSNLDPTSTADQSSAYLFGIWGLGGNLAEISQERDKDTGNYVVRGGSYETTGVSDPIASRHIVKDIKKDSLGYRVALYVKDSIDIDSLENKDGVFFDEEVKGERYVRNWDGMKVYEEPDVTTIIGKINFLQKVNVTGKAIQEITTGNGTNIIWARILVEDKEYYVNAYDLANVTIYDDNFGNKLNFIIGNKPEGVTRYHKKGLCIYRYPNDKSEKFIPSYAGCVQVIGKQIDKKWAVIKYNNKECFVHANDLTETAELKETGNGFKIIIDDEVGFEVVQNGLTSVYSEPDSNIEIKKLYKNEKVTVMGISTDLQWFMVRAIDGMEGFVRANTLALSKSQ